MAERYKQLLKTGMQYQKDCPVLLAASALLIDTQTQHVCAQLKLQSLVGKSISAVNVMLECFDPAGLTVLCHEEYWFRDLTIQFGDQFGQKTAIPISNDAARKFVVHIKTVVFTNGHTWNAHEPGEIMQTLPEREPLDTLYDPELAELYVVECMKLSKQNTAVTIRKQDHINYCACGVVYDSLEEKCPNCNIAFSVYEQLSKKSYLEGLLPEYQETQRKAAERAKEQAAELQRTNEEKANRERLASAKRQKVKSTRVRTGLGALVVVIAIFVFVYTVIVPASNYKKASNLMTSGAYAEAAEIFNKLRRYKNANDLSIEAYTKAGNMKMAGILLAQAGDYNGAYNAYDFSTCIAAGDSITLAVKKDGTVYSTDSYFSKYYPYFSGLENIAEVYCYDDYPKAVGLDGEWFSTGGMIETYVGYDENAVYEMPDRISTVLRRDHALVMTSSGEIIAIGDNDKGQCNVSAWTDILAIDAGIGFSAGLKNDGTVILAGNNDLNNCDVSSWDNIIKIDANDYHIVGLRADGTVVATGQNEDGQCDISDWTDIVAIAAGLNNTIGLKVDGTVMAVGNNDYGKCDISDWKLW